MFHSGEIMRQGLFAISVVAGLTSAGTSQGVFAETPMPSPISSVDINTGSLVSRIALGSCFAPQLDHDIWNGVKASKPDLFLFTGDNVYSSEETENTDLPFLKEAYQLLGDVRGFAELRSTVPVMVTWDDHDYGMNDAGASWIARQEAEELHEHVWAQSKSDPRRSRDGVYYSGIIGPDRQRVQVIMLDTRFFRSDLKPSSDRKRFGKFEPSSAVDKTMLGAEQWSWLAAELRKEADVRLVVSSVAIVADNHDMEGWRTLPLERQKLYDLIDDTAANGVILISGDRHFAGFYRETENVPYPLVEFMSSSMNLPITGDTAIKYRDESEPRKISTSVMQANFGTVDIDWQQRKVEFHIRDEAGNSLRTHQLNIDDLQKR